MNKVREIRQKITRSMKQHQREQIFFRAHITPNKIPLTESTTIEISDRVYDVFTVEICPIGRSVGSRTQEF